MQTKNKLPDGEYLSLVMAYPMGEAYLRGTKVDMTTPAIPNG